MSWKSENTRRNEEAASASNSLIEVKSKFDSEFRRFSLLRNPLPSVVEFRSLVESLHNLSTIPFTLCYTDISTETLPITNDENFRKALESARPILRLLIQRKGESWQEKYGYGSGSMDRRTKVTKSIVGTLLGDKAPRRLNYNISMPEDFRQVSAIIDVDVVPETHRRVKLCKHGSDKPLGFYIRDGTSVRVTPAGVVKVPGIFISRLLPGGLAQSTGLLAVNDEVLEVNGIEVVGKTLDQVTDMMVANASNLIITVKPANQRLTLNRGTIARASQMSEISANSEARSSSLYASNSDEELQDEVKDLLNANHKVTQSPRESNIISENF